MNLLQNAALEKKDLLGSGNEVKLQRFAIMFSVEKLNL